jgi:hypothetical protein
MRKKLRKSLIVGVIIISMLVTTPSIVSREIELLDNPVEFTFTGPTQVVEGTTCNYTFYLSPNPESDEYTVKVHWKEGDMIIYEYPREGVFYTGEDNEIWYVWYKSFPWDSGIYYPKATAYCGNSTYEATLEVTVPKNKPFSHYQSNWLFEYFPILYRIVQLIRLQIL